MIFFFGYNFCKFCEFAQFAYYFFFTHKKKTHKNREKKTDNQKKKKIKSQKYICRTKTKQKSKANDCNLKVLFKIESKTKGYPFIQAIEYDFLLLRDTEAFFDTACFIIKRKLKNKTLRIEITPAITFMDPIFS